MGAFPIPRISVEEYLRLDDESELPLEYHDGEVFEIEGASIAHGAIGSNVSRRVSERLDHSPCRSYIAPLVRVSASKYLYPDLVVVCGKVITSDDRAKTLVNPKVIVEILSPSTEGYDCHRKFAFYQQIPTFEEYILIAQDQPKVEVFRKAPENRWILSIYEGAGAIALVESLEIELPLDQIYAGIEFE